ncbi:winged helix/forkhead transcription factor [Lithospermum erythrorhizon]|uniref:Winged helix/forkhead transcription factor n=1 Tax=Lithospermum erythrorhizon TaxID=34254 RepID=A0AAV3P702_LITER
MSTTTQRSVPAPFLTKTYQLVDDHRTDDVVSWNGNGTTFVVWKTAEFAKDLLPNYFKHNNFSSFVRQLNTYGFRKTVPDKWEFANDKFKLGQKELLTQIRRRKTIALSTPAAAGTSTSPTNSGEDIALSSTSSPDTKIRGMAETSSSDAELTELADQNESLRNENLTLSVELAQSKKQCDELVHLLTCHLKVSPKIVDEILRGGVDNKSYLGDDHVDKYDNDDNDDDENGESLKLFGVMLKDKKRKREPEEENTNDIGSGNASEINKFGQGADFFNVNDFKNLLGANREEQGLQLN